VLEIAERAAERWETVYTDFLSPPVAADAMSALSQVPDLLALPWGGYPQAERCRWAE
jgi:RNA-binding protein YlmH